MTLGNLEGGSDIGPTIAEKIRQLHAEPPADAAADTQPAEATPEPSTAEPASVEPAASTPAAPPETEPAAAPGDEPPAAPAAATTYNLADALKASGLDISKFTTPEEAAAYAIQHFRQKLAERPPQAPAGAATPDATQPPAAAAAPQTPPAAAPGVELLEADVQRAVEQDPECISALNTYNQTTRRLVALEAIDPRTGQRLGEIPTLANETIPTLQQDILKLQARVELAREAQLPQADVLAFELASKRSELADAKSLLASKRADQLQLALERREHESFIRSRAADYRHEIGGQYEAETNRAEQERQLDQRATDFVARFGEALSTVATSLKITDPDVLRRVEEKAVSEARIAADRIRAAEDAGRNPGPRDQAIVKESVHNTRGFIERHAKAEMDYIEKRLRPAARQVAERKLEDIKPQAPAGKAAVAAAPPQTPKDEWVESFVDRVRNARRRAPA